MALIDETNDLIYSTPETGYKLYDILWSDGKATQEVRPVSDGVVPIGLCVIPTNWLDEGEKARFMSLHLLFVAEDFYGNFARNNYDLYWGVGYGEGSPAPYDDEDDDPLDNYYVPYYCIDENSGQDVTCAYFSKTNNQAYYSFKDLRDRDNWLYTLNYCKQNPGKYAIGDINGKQNTINISVEGNWYMYKEYDAKYVVNKYAPTGTNPGDWYIPALGELVHFCFIASELNKKLLEISKIYPENCKYTTYFDNNTYKSSTVRDGGHLYACEVDNYLVGRNSDDEASDYRSSVGSFVAFLQR